MTYPDKLFTYIFYYFLVIMFSFLLVEVFKTTIFQSFLMGIIIGIFVNIYVLPIVKFNSKG